MNLLNLKLKNPKNKFLYPVILTVLFIIFIYLNRFSFFQQFEPNIVNNYLRSQDIEDRKELIKDRIFISDSEIYTASGSLYVNGKDPRNYNFQHPPFIKYLFGLSAKHLGFALIPQIIFAGLLIFGVYILGIKAFKSPIIGLLSSVLILFDPVFKEVTTYALLDLGQIVFLLWFFITTLYFSKNYLLEGVLLGLAAASKFYSPVIIFAAIVYIYKFLIKKEKLDFKKYLLIFLTAFLIFFLTYIFSFIKDKGLFNIFFFQGKIVKFMLDHNTADSWGGVLKLFFGGYILWSLMFFINLFLLFKIKIKDSKFLIFIVPVIFLLLFTFQLPFTRYFILILPFLYLGLFSFICEKY